MTEATTTNQKIFDKLDTITGQYGEISGRLDVIDEKLSHKPDDIQVIMLMDEKLEKHVQTCPLLLSQDDISQVINMEKYRTPEARAMRETSDSIRIKISGLPLAIKWLIGVLLAGGFFAGGHFGAELIDNDNETQTEKD